MTSIYEAPTHAALKGKSFTCCLPSNAQVQSSSPIQTDTYHHNSEELCYIEFKGGREGDVDCKVIHASKLQPSSSKLVIMTRFYPVITTMTHL